MRGLSGAAVPHVTVYLSTVSVPITVLLCSGPLLCGFNVLVKRLKMTPMFFSSVCTTAAYAGIAP